MRWIDTESTIVGDRLPVGLEHHIASPIGRSGCLEIDLVKIVFAPPQTERGTIAAHHLVIGLCLCYQVTFLLFVQVAPRIQTDEVFSFAVMKTCWTKCLSNVFHDCRVIHLVVLFLQHIPTHPSHRSSLFPVVTFGGNGGTGIGIGFHAISPILEITYQETGAADGRAIQTPMGENIMCATTCHARSYFQTTHFRVIGPSDSDGTFPVVMIDGSNDDTLTSVSLIQGCHFITGDGCVQSHATIANKTIVVIRNPEHAVVGALLQQGVANACLHRRKLIAADLLRTLQFQGEKQIGKFIVLSEME